MLDVHPPHQAAHGPRDFFIHLFTITVGLLIALSLEGLVEWQHHRHLVHQAEQSLHTEIQNNSQGMSEALVNLHKEQESLKRDVTILKEVLKTRKFPKNGSMEIGFNIRGFHDVSWRTAQNTGALSYMPYDLAQQYSSIYAEQELLAAAEQQAARDTIISLSPMLNMTDTDPDPPPAQIESMQHQIEVLQGQLLLVDSFMKSLDTDYKQFLAAHHEE